MRPPASTISFKPETVGSRCLIPSRASSARRAVNSASSATSSTLAPVTARNIASRSFTSRAFSICSVMPILRAAAWDSRTYWAAVGLVSRTRIAILAGFGMSSVTSCNRFAITSPLMLVMPVMLPPGRARLATRPSLTGSSPTPKTIGIVVVAALAASAAAPLPGVAMTSTRRRTSSAMSEGMRS